MSSLPFELIAHIFQVALTLEPQANGRTLCLVSRVHLAAARKALYYAPHLTRHNIAQFQRTLASSQLTFESDAAPALHSLVHSLVFGTASLLGSPGHEHVQVRAVLDVLSRCAESVQEIALDMTCSTVACSWTDNATDRELEANASVLASLPRLRELSIRSPKGYMPPGARRLLEAALGQSPSVRSLNLFWTQPGPFNATGNTDSLQAMLAACPHIETLRIVSAAPPQGSSSIFGTTRTVLHTASSDTDRLSVPASDTPRLSVSANLTRAPSPPSYDSATRLSVPDSARLSVPEPDNWPRSRTIELDHTAAEAAPWARDRSASIGQPILNSLGLQLEPEGDEAGFSSAAVREAVAGRDRSTSIASAHKDLPVLTSHAQTDSGAAPVAVQAAVRRAAARLGRGKSFAAITSRVVVSPPSTGQAAVKRWRSAPSDVLRATQVSAEPRVIIGRGRAPSAATDIGWDTFVGSLLSASAPRAAAAP